MEQTGSPPLQRQEVDPRKRAFSILARVAQARSIVYGWLALSFYEPSEAFHRALVDGTLAAELTACTVWLGRDQQFMLPGLQGLAASATCELDDLLAEHQRLFGKSVDRVSPCESTYRWKGPGDLLNEAGDLQRGLQQLYSQFGVSPVEGPVDHIAVQMEFMAYLCQREAREWLAGAAQAARQLRRQESGFLADHPGKWVPEFHRRLSRHGGSSFYAAAAGLADRWLELEQGPDYGSVGVE